MAKTPRKLQEFLELLIGIADRFREVPAEIARRPFPTENLVPHCESQAYFWPEDRSDGTLGLHFAVENPQGVSARAMAVILDESLSGELLEEVVGVEDDLPYEIFGRAPGLRPLILEKIESLIYPWTAA